MKREINLDKVEPVLKDMIKHLSQDFTVTKKRSCYIATKETDNYKIKVHIARPTQFDSSYVITVESKHYLDTSYDYKILRTYSGFKKYYKSLKIKLGWKTSRTFSKLLEQYGYKYDTPFTVTKYNTFQFSRTERNAISTLTLDFDKDSILVENEFNTPYFNYAFKLDNYNQLKEYLELNPTIPKDNRVKYPSSMKVKEN
ncbi:hypothetical protein Alsa1_CDS0124 [Staphylococcus phage Alsa_1]|mgnify:CR=1 FL=1|nr:hypothetical protein Alsa1_CDS0124 [Staphylococcus phage Alsa_1]WNM51042.1 hypothetical protein Alsa3_CDS0173 [Staphylococcus phage Alsa_3]WNM51298.1 hypothetical protein Alsa4_CDS0168 [Staphylococcus phage Alsa_4]